MALEANHICDLAQDNSVCDGHWSTEPVLAVESSSLIPQGPFKPLKKQGDYLDTYFVS